MNDADRYSFHGIGITLSSETSALAEAIGGRLRQFSTERPCPPGLEFEFRLVAERSAHRVHRPQGSSCPVYDPPEGEVAYFESEDLLYIDYGGRVRVLCEPASGRARASVLRSERNRLWLLSRPLLTLPLVELLKRPWALQHPCCRH